jgi:uroporphyrinogen-III decarboxylase
VLPFLSFKPDVVILLSDNPAQNIRHSSVLLQTADAFCYVCIVCHVAALLQLQAGWRNPVQRHPDSALSLAHHAADASSAGFFCCFLSIVQPFRSFKPDGVILFSDILTPLPGIGMPFEIDDNKGPLLDNPIRSKEQVRCYII